MLDTIKAPEQTITSTPAEMAGTHIGNEAHQLLAELPLQPNSAQARIASGVLDMGTASDVYGGSSGSSATDNRASQRDAASQPSSTPVTDKNTGTNDAVEKHTAPQKDSGSNQAVDQSVPVGVDAAKAKGADSRDGDLKSLVAQAQWVTPEKLQELYQATVKIMSSDDKPAAADESKTQKHPAGEIKAPEHHAPAGEVKAADHHTHATVVRGTGAGGHTEAAHVVGPEVDAATARKLDGIVHAGLVAEDDAFAVRGKENDADDQLANGHRYSHDKEGGKPVYGTGLFGEPAVVGYDDGKGNSVREHGESDAGFSAKLADGTTVDKRMGVGVSHPLTMSEKVTFSNGDVMEYRLDGSESIDLKDGKNYVKKDLNSAWHEST